MADDMISWIDYCAQRGKKAAGAFDTGEYYKNVVTREQFFETLKSIYADVQEKAPNEQTVSNVKVEDTITSEFDVNTSEEGDLVTVDKGEEVVITVYNKYIGKAFFHASDTIKNIFHHK